MVDEVKTDQRVHVPDADPRSLENLDIAAAVTGAAGNICETVRERMLLHEADFRARKLAPIEHKKVFNEPLWRNSPRANAVTFRPDYTKSGKEVASFRPSWMAKVTGHHGHSGIGCSEMQ